MCELIEEDNYKRICYSFIALKHKDITICNNINDGEEKAICVVYVALVTKDVKLCDYAEEEIDDYWKRKCISRVDPNSEDGRHIERAESILKSKRI